VAAHLGAAVAGELDEVDVVEDRGGAGDVREEDEARLQRADEERLPAVVVGGKLGSELANAGRDLRCGQVDLPDPVVRGGAPS
jgi:hypothetical protein